MITPASPAREPHVAKIQPLMCGDKQIWYGHLDCTSGSQLIECEATTGCQLVVTPKQVLPCTIIAVEPQALRDLETREDGSFDSLVALFPVARRCAGIVYGTGKDEFRKKKNPEMSPTMAQHFRYTRFDPPPERFAVGVPFAFATSCFRQGHRRYAQRTWRRETHRD